MARKNSRPSPTWRTTTTSRPGAGSQAPRPSAGRRPGRSADKLDPRSRRIIEARWLDVNDDGSGGATLHELADEFGVSAERIRQIESAAMKKMKGALAAFA
jgi:hypothetical protein